MFQGFNAFVAAAASVVAVAGILGHLKNYRKPHDQRLVVRILVMVPLFATSAYANLYHPRLAGWLEPLKELYEAFVIYTFFTLLTSILGGEREIIFLTTGRPPVRFFWPLSKCLAPIDISDPTTFVLLKRSIMQYVWMRPLLTALTFVFGDRVWLLVTIAYNFSLTIALNALSVFWYCLYADLKPYNVMLKFLSIKLIVFFSYWQSLALAIVHSLGWIRNSHTLATVQNALLLYEMVGFACLHWVAFPYTDYATSALIGFGRLPIYYAARDAFGGRDLVHDFKTTFFGEKYGYRDFDSVEAILDHPESLTRQARLAAGLRYRNQGRTKYWLPIKSFRQRIGVMMAPASENEAVLGGETWGADGSENEAASAWGAAAGSTVNSAASVGSSVLSTELPEQYSPIQWDHDDVAGDESLYQQARLLFGDFNYPVITVRESVPYRTIEERERERERRARSYGATA